jgi:alpha-L-fucosidase
LIKRILPFRPDAIAGLNRSMRWILIPLLFSLAYGAVAQTQTQTTPDNDKRMEWWREARLGMFIHWGLYSIPAGKWDGHTNYGEWIREEAHIPVKEYEKFQKEFNPTDFNADKIVSMAKDAGMKYIVITTKHHDGFCLFDSQYTDWCIRNTPYHKDIMKMMAAACKKYGLKMCWYHSIMDWHEPDYLPRRTWEVKDRPVDGANFRRYVQHLRDQVTELLTNYGPIGVMWFDGEWEATWNAKDGKALYDLCRKLQPNVIVNNRVSVDRGGSMEAVNAPHTQVGDFSTPEQFIPPTGLGNVDWETCMTMNDHWGYNAYDKDWKSPTVLIHNIIDIASKGGNYLLNIGPESTGDFPPEAITRLKAIGDYMKVNGGAIYDTKASVFEDLPWGRSTTREKGSTTTLFLHVFDWPKDGKLVVPSIGNTPDGAKLMATGASLNCQRVGSDIVIDLPDAVPDAISSTVVLTVEGAPIVYKTPKISSPSDVLVSSVQVTLSGGNGQDIRYTTDGSEPTNTSTLYGSPITVSDTTTIKAAAFHGDTKVTSTASKDIQKVAANPAMDVADLESGLSCQEFHGDWDKMPDFSNMKPAKSFVATKLDFPMKNGVAEEHVGRHYTGYIDVPSDEVYVFGLTSDDGSMLYIDGKLVVDNDGPHSATLKGGSAALAKGKHSITIDWFNATGGADLELKWGPIGQPLNMLSAGDVWHSK